MKPVIIPCMALMLLTMRASSQSMDRNFNGIAFAEAYDVHGRPFTEANKNDFDGTPLLNDNWGTGTVWFSRGKVLRDLALQLDLYENRLYFKQDGKVYFFYEPVTAFAFTYTDANNQPMSVYFRNGYPATGLNHSQSFYQVLADGKNIQLLKYYYKVLADVLNYGGPVRKKYDQREQVFIYDAASETLTPVKKEKQFFSKALPGYASAIDSFVQQTGSKLRTEQDMISLVNMLNNLPADVTAK